MPLLKNEKVKFHLHILIFHPWSKSKSNFTVILSWKLNIFHFIILISSIPIFPTKKKSQVCLKSWVPTTTPIWVESQSFFSWIKSYSLKSIYLFKWVVEYNVGYEGFSLRYKLKKRKQDIIIPLNMGIMTKFCTKFVSLMLQSPKSH